MAPKSVAKSNGIKKRRSGPKAPEFGGFLTKLRQQTNPGVGSSAAAQYLLNDLIVSLVERLIKKTGTLAQYDRKDTVKARHASTASAIVLVGPLASHASDFATAAVAKFAKA